MARTKKRKPRIPQVIRKLYGKRVLNLANTLVSLIPNPASLSPPSCSCIGSRPSGCLQCTTGERAKLLLLRPDDPSDYRKLLNSCYVVIDENAPPLGHFRTDNRWGQIKIVRRVIESLTIEQKMPDGGNVICSGYDKLTRSSPITELLGANVWSLLLKRVGDDLMFYLLKYASIFLQLPCMTYQQVAGLPISDLAKRLKDEQKLQPGRKRPFVNQFGISEDITKRARFSEDNSTSVQQQTSSNHNMLDSRKQSSPRGFTKVAEINRKHIFYCSDESSSVLPKNHVLRTSKPIYAHSKLLLHDIFGSSDETGSDQLLTCSNNNGSCQIRSKCLHHSLSKLLKALIFRTQRCNHLNLLNKHCAVPSTLEKTGKEVRRSSSNLKPCSKAKAKAKSKADTDTKINALESYCTKHQVVSFIWAVCRNVVPSDLLGSSRILMRNIAKFINLRRYEKFYLKQCMHKLKTSSFPFLSNKLTNGANQLKHILLEKWMFWFFSNLVVPLLREHFYITEIEHGKLDVFYYPNSAWEKLQDQTMTCLEDQNYRRIDYGKVLGIVNNRPSGFSRLRLVPKEKSVRLVANLRAASRLPAPNSSPPYRYLKSVNGVLSGAHAVLRGILSKEPEKFGSSVFDYNDIYKKLCPFIISLKRASISLPDVFIVVSDVSKAFDSVNQDKLLSIMNEVLSSNLYCLKQAKQVVCTKKAFWVQERSTLSDPNIATDCKRRASPVVDASSVVLVNQGLEKKLSRFNLFRTLTDHLKFNILRMGDLFYLQDKGIPQGSIISSLLCSLYYGHLDRHVIFPHLDKTSQPNIKNASPVRQLSGSANAVDCYVLLRLIDDFLLITTSKNQAASFVSKLKRGFDEYNCYMNQDKYCLNFDTGRESQLQTKRICVSHDGTSFLPWSGLLLNSSTLDIQADYSRYLKNPLSSCLTINWEKGPSRHLKRKLRAFMRPKCHALFYDSNINSAPIVRLNVFQAFLLCAMKFHCYISEMSYICKLPTKCLLKIIEHTWRYTHTLHKLIKRRMNSASSGSHPRPVLQLEKTEVVWLAIKAYIAVLKKKQSRHRDLLSMLRSKLSAHPLGNGENVKPELKYAVDRSNSSLLWGIKY
ncbi:Telomerase reverse transcriptase [Linum perenne]